MSTRAGDLQFFLGSTAAAVRSMPIGDACTYLRGLLSLVGEDEAIEPLREIYRNLDMAAAQLELIPAPQMRLDLPEAKPAA